MARTLRIYGLYCFATALTLVSLEALAFTGSESVYLLCAALLHALFGIWSLKGAQSSAFGRATILPRLLMGMGLLAAAVFGGLFTASWGLQFRLVLYGAVAGPIEALAALWTWRSLPTPAATTTRPPMSFEAKNRLAFGLYMCVLGSWLTLDANSFLTLIRMPPSHYVGWFELPRPGIGPMQILGLQVGTLGFYNIIAARNGITELVAAGMRGGLVTCVVFVLLAVFGLVHPLALLIPGVDLISVALIALRRLRS